MARFEVCLEKGGKCVNMTTSTRMDWICDAFVYVYILHLDTIDMRRAYS